MVRYLRAFGEELARCGRPLVLYELIFRALSLAILVPALTWFLSTILPSGGRVAIANEEILHFLLTFRGVAAVICFGVLSIFVFFAEQAGIIAILASSFDNRPLSALAAIVRAIKLLPRLLVLALLYTVAIALLLVPLLLIVGLTYWLLLSDGDIYFFVSVQPPRFLVAVGIAAVAGLGFTIALAVLYVRWSFSLPLMVVKGTGPMASLKGSHEATANNRTYLAKLLISWLLLITGVSLVVGWLVYALGGALVARAGDSLSLAIAAVAIVLALEFLVATIATFIGFCGNNFLIVKLYYEMGGAVLSDSPDAMALKSGGRLSRWKRGVGLALVVIVVATGVMTLAILQQSNVPIRPVGVTAHRGASLVAPENTLSAIKAAIDIGADFAEIDVQLTSDGRVVVIHDSDLKRVGGVNKRVAHSTYKELRAIEVGSWFSAEFKGEKIPSLEEVVDLAKGKIKLNIELKVSRKDPKLIASVLSILQKKKFESGSVISSLDYPTVVETHRKNPTMPVGFITFRALGNIAEVEADFFSLNDAQLNESLVHNIHVAGKEVHVWAVDAASRMLGLIELGVDNIITDHPGRLIKLQKELQQLNQLERMVLSFRYRMAN